MTYDGLRLMLLAVQLGRACCWRHLYLATEGSVSAVQIDDALSLSVCRLGARFPVSAGQDMTSNWPAG